MDTIEFAQVEEPFFYFREGTSATHHVTLRRTGDLIGEASVGLTLKTSSSTDITADDLLSGTVPYVTVTFPAGQSTVETQFVVATRAGDGIEGSAPFYEERAILALVDPVNATLDRVTTRVGARFVESEGRVEIGDDIVSVSEDKSILVDVQANDTFINADPARYSSVYGDLDATLQFPSRVEGLTIALAENAFTSPNGNPANGLRITPDAHFSGQVSFKYAIVSDVGARAGLKADSRTTAEGSITVTVTPEPDPPQAGDDAFGVTEKIPGTFTTAKLLANDTDPDGDTLQVISVGAAEGGTVVLNDDDTFTFTSAADLNDISASFEYTISDGNGGTDTATVTMFVTPPPRPEARDDVFVADKNTAKTVSVAQLLANDINTADGALTVTAVGAAQGGTVVLNADDTVTFTPDADFTGAASFIYTLSDGTGGTDTGRVDLQVTPDPDSDAPITLTGTAANDTLESGSGNDTIDGQGGNDVIIGLSGDDQLTGGTGQDLILGGLGNDGLSGGADRDFLLEVSGINTLSGGDADDLLIGGFQADALFGDAGNDQLYGDTSPRWGGSDTLDGGTGDDRLMGGPGADTFVFRPDNGTDIIAAFALSPDATDSPTGADFQPGVDVIMLEGFANITATNVLDFVTDDTDGALFNAQSTAVTLFGITVADLQADHFEIV